MTEPQGPEAPILECRNLSISYFTRAGEVPVVVDFNLALEKGEAVGLVGESGCGKSTLAFAIMRYLGNNAAIVGGQILYRGQDLAGLDAERLRQLRGNEIAMVYQEPMAALNPSMTLGDQLLEVPLFHEDIGKKEALERVRQMLRDVDLPDPGRILKSYPHQLSGGQQQRVVIAMALLSNPALLILDEPTTSLDVTVEAGIISLIGEIKRKFDSTIIYISHNLGLILETCDRVNVMYSGTVVESGGVTDVFDHMRHPYTRGLFDCIPLPGDNKNSRPLRPIRGHLPLPQDRPPGCVFGPRCDFFEAGTCDTSAPAMESVGSGAEHAVRCRRWRDIDWQGSRIVEDTAEPEDPSGGGEVLRAERMSKHYRITDRSLMALITGRGAQELKANQDISFSAEEARTVAIVGESGCGKSSFAKVLMGLESANDGLVCFQGEDVSHFPVQKRPADLVGSLQMVFQNPFDTLNPSRSVGQQLARVVRRFGGERRAEKVDKRVEELLELVKLPKGFAARRPRQLSGGQKQRVGIARAFAGRPKLVVADEPLSALDLSVQAAIAALLLDIQRNYRTTLLFISHDLSLVRYLADKVVVMYLGHIVEQGTTDEVFLPPYHPYTEALLSAIPVADTQVRRKRILLEGEPPSPIDPPKGCPFNTRCHRNLGAICHNEPPPNVEVSPGHFVACHIDIWELRQIPPVVVVS